MKAKYSAEAVLGYVIEVVMHNLEELESLGNDEDFIYGEKTGYVECLEIIQLWKKAKKYGLDYNIEERFSLNLPKNK